MILGATYLLVQVFPFSVAILEGWTLSSLRGGDVYDTSYPF